MVELGLLNDAAFAENRARGLALNGRSRRAITARLMAKGIDPAHARAVLPEGDESELVVGADPGPQTADRSVSGGSDRTITANWRVGPRRVSRGRSR